MLTHVKHLQEALQRFNPEAYLTPNVDIQGISPATECLIASTYDEEKENRIIELQKQIDGLEKALDDIAEECAKKTPNIEKIKDLCTK